MRKKKEKSTVKYSVARRQLAEAVASMFGETRESEMGRMNEGDGNEKKKRQKKTKPARAKILLERVIEFCSRREINGERERERKASSETP